MKRSIASTARSCSERCRCRSFCRCASSLSRVNYPSCPISPPRIFRFLSPRRFPSRWPSRFRGNGWPERFIWPVRWPCSSLRRFPCAACCVWCEMAAANVQLVALYCHLRGGLCRLRCRNHHPRTGSSAVAPFVGFVGDRLGGVPAMVQSGDVVVAARTAGHP